MLHPLITRLSSHILDGKPLSEEQGNLLADLESGHTTELLFAANAITRAMGHRPFTCSITNAKSGTCSQDCRFCAQSGHYDTGSPTHALLPLEKLIDRGLAMHQAGAACYSLVTSGLMLSSDEIDRITACIEALKSRTSLQLSASLGLLNPDYARRLTRAGLTRYHHNLETARSHFPSICTTHSYDEDIATIRLAKEHGLRICSGGILGLGESWAQRVELAATLAELDVDTVPLNFLSPIAGTPLQDSPLLSVHDALKSVALFRFMLPKASITIAGGRERVLGDYQSWLPLAGANGMMIGNYLTTKGRDLDADLKMLEQGAWI
ncbi:biotin synthase [Desulfomicrobium norvegicum]|uniref:Biotin synthase n=1 Tax=Desulfomicrobium norvegicum (strain DSM 1741 / NCIMB 8310) TaxID=52561 RepID=A0A8G2C2Z6_DESNO|nr:biotin synthase BioB [Desulfomicrobium norvegicum]SFL73361.1 biotin synthase [Desulfomicrobium norvegicum]